MRTRTRPLRLLLCALAVHALTSCAAAPAPEARALRSANLSHITGTSRNIQLFLKNRYLQLLPDGTVNGTEDGNSVHTILQRATYKVGLLTIQGVATCLYLCMDQCGFQYAHKDLSEDCVFEEHIEENNYNTYSRVRAGKKAFVALDNRGKARRTQIPVNRPLGNLSVYALTMTRRWEGQRQLQCAPRRHRGKLKQPSPFHRNCMRRVQRQNVKQKRKQKRGNIRNRHRHPKARRRHGNSTTTTTDTSWDESTMSTMSTTTDAEFFRSAAAQEAVGRA